MSNCKTIVSIYRKEWAEEEEQPPAISNGSIRNERTKVNKQLKDNTITQEEYNKKLEEYFKIEEKVNAETIKLAQSQKRVAEIMGDSLAAYEANNDILKQFKEITGDAYESTENLTQAQIEAIEIAGFQADAFIQLAKEAHQAEKQLARENKKAEKTRAKESAKAEKKMAENNTPIDMKISVEVN